MLMWPNMCLGLTVCEVVCPITMDYLVHLCEYLHSYDWPNHYNVEELLFFTIKVE